MQRESELQKLDKDLEELRKSLVDTEILQHSAKLDPDFALQPGVKDKLAQVKELFGQILEANEEYKTEKTLLWEPLHKDSLWKATT